MTASFSYAPLLPVGDDNTEYRLISDEGVDVVEGPGGRRFLTVEPSVLTTLTAEAMHDIAHFLRPAHLAQLRAIIDDPKASANDRFVAIDLLRTGLDRAYRHAPTRPVPGESRQAAV